MNINFKIFNKLNLDIKKNIYKYIIFLSPTAKIIKNIKRKESLWTYHRENDICRLLVGILIFTNKSKFYRHKHHIHYNDLNDTFFGGIYCNFCKKSRADFVSSSFAFCIAVNCSTSFSCGRRTS